MASVVIVLHAMAQYVILWSFLMWWKRIDSRFYMYQEYSSFGNYSFPSCSYIQRSCEFFVALHAFSRLSFVQGCPWFPICCVLNYAVIHRWVYSSVPVISCQAPRLVISRFFTYCWESLPVKRLCNIRTSCATIARPICTSQCRNHCFPLSQNV